MLKNILVFLDGGEESQRGLPAAVNLAHLTDGRIRGLFVKKIELVEIGLLPPTQTWARRRRSCSTLSCWRP